MGHSPSTINPDHHRLVDRERYRSVMGHFASGVTIITTRHEGIDYGLTASAVSSLSLDPPMLLICVNKIFKHPESHRPLSDLRGEHFAGGSK